MGTSLGGRTITQENRSLILTVVSVSLLNCALIYRIFARRLTQTQRDLAKYSPLPQSKPHKLEGTFPLCLEKYRGDALTFLPDVLGGADIQAYYFL